MEHYILFLIVQYQYKLQEMYEKILYIKDGQKIM